MRRRNEENSVRVTNLSEDTREPDLLELFRPFGPVSRVYVAIDQKTGDSRGFGFINFVNKEDAQRAIDKLNGYGYDNLILRVEWAAPRTNYIRTYFLKKTLMFKILINTCFISVIKNNPIEQKTKPAKIEVGRSVSDVQNTYLVIQQTLSSSSSFPSLRELHPRNQPWKTLPIKKNTKPLFKSTTTTLTLSELCRAKASLVKRIDASVQAWSELCPDRKHMRATPHAVSFETTSHSPSLANIKHSSSTVLSVVVTSGSDVTYGFNNRNRMLGINLAHTLWSVDRGIGTPFLQSTARESPQLDTTILFGVRTATTAVDPTASHCGV
ncbi:hypothetical protein H5410_015981 [Solanum commersonii]|uniref:RRM domain-containing protein n=1 Tax=Solanum commersonii TaxID=4109 RepID=A0A9J5ZV05_SOLCO|nr:hypothetical protein H5410_015981 [Solanum commersonii]